MAKLRPNNNDRFYDEITGRNFSSGWCTAPLIALVGLMVLIFGVIIIWSTVKPLDYDPTEKTIPVHLGGLKLPVSWRLGNSAGSAEEFRLRLSDAELLALLNAANIPNTTDRRVATHPKTVDISANITSPIKAPMIMKIVPQIKDGRIAIEVNDLTVGGVRALPLATSAVRESIASSLQGAVDAQIKGQLTRIVLEEGAMNIYWKAS